jgi:hypothetical protein
MAGADIIFDSRAGATYFVRFAQRSNSAPGGFRLDVYLPRLFPSAPGGAPAEGERHVPIHGRDHAHDGVIERGRPPAQDGGRTPRGRRHRIGRRGVGPADVATGRYALQVRARRRPRRLHAAPRRANVHPAHADDDRRRRGSIVFRPPTLGHWRARAEFLGTRTAEPCRTRRDVHFSVDTALQPG